MNLTEPLIVRLRQRIDELTDQRDHLEEQLLATRLAAKRHANRALEQRKRAELWRNRWLRR